MPPRIPTEDDFAQSPPLSIHLPHPPESTTTFLLLLHGLGDSDAPFSLFARSLNLPSVCSLSIRGTSPLPLADDEARFHWGDDLRIDTATGEVDPDPGFERAASLILKDLVGDTLVRKLGWESEDVLFFGFGQGGSLALGLALSIHDMHDTPASGSISRGGRAKGVVSIGGPLPTSMTRRNTGKCKTPVCLVQLDEEDVALVKERFEHVTVINWARSGVSMPRNREEMYPIMKFLADQLNRL